MINRKLSDLRLGPSPTKRPNTNGHPLLFQRCSLIAAIFRKVRLITAHKRVTAAYLAKVLNQPELCNQAGSPKDTAALLDLALRLACVREIGPEEIF